MNKSSIKEKLLNLSKSFKQMSGTFDSFVIVHDYIEFLRLEPFTKKLMKPLADKLEVEANKLEKLAIHTPLPVYDSIEEFPFFKDEFNYFNQREFGSLSPDLSMGLSTNLALLSQVYILIEDIKDYQKNGDLLKANEIIEHVKRISLSTPQNILIKGIDTSNISMGKRLDISMELLNKYIIDEIDSQLLLEKAEIIKPIFYDDKKYTLYIRGLSVEIKRRNQLPLDHYILKSLSDCDFFDEVFYSEIISEYFEGDEKKYRSLYSACERLNKKISDKDNSIKDFLIYSSGRKGSCKVRSKYQ